MVEYIRENYCKQVGERLNAVVVVVVVVFVVVVVVVFVVDQ